jgi:hypothetical protein
MNTSRLPLRLALSLLAGAACALPGFAAGEPKERLAEVAANAELTEEGKKVPRPTPEHPVYYVPVTYGWHEEGGLIAGEEPPKRADVLRLVGQALAKEGYILQALRSDANTTLPSLIITVEWGYLNPVASEHGAANLTTGDGGTMAVAGMRDDPTQRESTPLNQSQMVELVAGSALQRQAFFSESDWQKLNAAVAEGRYYLIVSAYDFAASLKGEQVLLWRTRMSTPRQGVWMQAVVPALVTSGAALFGRQTDAPAWSEHRVREGRVEMGDIKIIDPDVGPSPSEPKDTRTSPAEMKSSNKKKP